MAEEIKTVLENIESRLLFQPEEGEKVVDPVSYKTWKKLSQNPLIVKHSLHTCSDGIVIDLKRLNHHVKRDIAHLSKDEQTKILTKKSKITSLINKSNQLKRKAYGHAVGRRKTRLDVFEDKKLELIELFGRMFSVDEVYEIVLKDWGLSCSIDSLTKFRKKNLEEISILIEEHKRSYSNVRLGIKRSRLDELTWLYHKHKQRYEETRNASDARMLRDVLEQIRKEVEGDSLTIDANVTVNMEQTINAHIQQELFRTIQLKEIILGRVAARAPELSAVELIASLRRSYYARYSSFATVSPQRIIDTPYPSELSFDFESTIKGEIANGLVREQEQIKTISIPTPSSSGTQDLLLQRLRKSQQSVEASKESVSHHQLTKSKSNA